MGWIALFLLGTGVMTVHCGAALANELAFRRRAILASGRITALHDDVWNTSDHGPLLGYPVHIPTIEFEVAPGTRTSRTVPDSPLIPGRHAIGELLPVRFDPAGRHEPVIHGASPHHMLRCGTGMLLFGGLTVGLSWLLAAAA